MITRLREISLIIETKDDEGKWLDNTVIGMDNDGKWLTSGPFSFKYIRLMNQLNKFIVKESADNMMRSLSPIKQEIE